MQVRSRRISTLSSKGNEAHGGYGFCALAAIIILDIQWQEWQEQGLSQGETLTRSLEDNNYPVVFPGAATPSERPLDKVDLEAFAGWVCGRQMRWYLKRKSQAFLSRIIL